MDATCAELTSRFYRLQLRGHQRVTIEVVANRIDSLLDPFVRVRDSRGRELASVDDTPGCEADARIEFIAPAAGAYFIEVRDTRHGGGPRYFFRLRIDGSAAEPLRFLPLMTSWKPAEPALPIFVEPAAKEAPTRTSVVHLVQPPVCIHGRFDAPGDRDVFQFATDKDEQWLIRGRSRTLSSPCDLYLRLEKPDGGLIAEADSTRADDGNLTNKFAEASTARLVVEELNHGGGPGFDYQIEIRPNDPGFTLNAGTNTITASPGGSFELKISAARWNFDGPIALSLAGLGKDFALTNEVLVVKQKDTTLKVTVPADFSATQLVSFSVIGNAANGERRLESRASTLPSLKAQLPQMLHPPLELDGLIFLGIQPENAPAK